MAKGLRVSRPIPLAVAALALLLTLSGCVGGSPAPATEAPQATAATPTPTQPPAPVDPLTTVTTLVATPEALELRDESGTVVTSLDYLSDPGPAITTLQTVFGAPPVSEEYQGSNHYAPSTAHRWGGFELWEQRYVERWEGLGTPSSLFKPGFRVTFTAAGYGGVDLLTDDGHHVGDSWTELLAEPELRTNPTGCSGPYLDFIEVTVVWSDGTEHLNKVGVDFQPSDDETLVSLVRAPMAIYEDGCA